jgi:hypothetical protein
VEAAEAEGVEAQAAVLPAETEGELGQLRVGDLLVGVDNELPGQPGQGVGERRLPLEVSLERWTNWRSDGCRSEDCVPISSHLADEHASAGRRLRRAKNRTGPRAAVSVCPAQRPQPVEQKIGGRVGGRRGQRGRGGSGIELDLPSEHADGAGGNELRAEKESRSSGASPSGRTPATRRKWDQIEDSDSCTPVLRRQRRPLGDRSPLGSLSGGVGEEVVPDGLHERAVRLGNLRPPLGLALEQAEAPATLFR